MSCATLLPTRKLDGDRVDFLNDIFPMQTEPRAIEAYTGPEDQLAPTELWFRKLVGTCRIGQKVEVIRTMETFSTETEALHNKLHLLTKVCHQVMNSEKLQVLLDIFVQVGNVLNKGTRTGGAVGFKFDSLLKLTQTKSSDGKTTVLDFVVTIFAANDQKADLELLAEFQNCPVARCLSISDLVNQFGALWVAIQKYEDEREALSNDLFGRGASKLPRGNATFQPIKKSAAWLGEVQNELMASLISRNKLDGTSASQSQVVGKPTAQEPILVSIKQGTLANTHSTLNASRQAKLNDDLTTAPEIKQAASAFETDTVEEGSERLKEVIREGRKTLVNLDSSHLEALNACKDLSEYCGEGSATGTTSKLLEILSQFASNVHAAVNKFDHQQAIQARQKREGQLAPKLAVKKAATTSTSRDDTPPTKNLLDEKLLVLRVNKWLRDDADYGANRKQTKQDYSKSCAYPQASDRLDAMYQTGKEVAGRNILKSCKRAPWRTDLVHERDSRIVKDRGCKSQGRKERLEE